MRSFIAPAALLNLLLIPAISAAAIPNEAGSLPRDSSYSSPPPPAPAWPSPAPAWPSPAPSPPTPAPPAEGPYSGPPLPTISADNSPAGSGPGSIVNKNPCTNPGNKGPVTGTASGGLIGASVPIDISADCLTANLPILDGSDLLDGLDILKREPTAKEFNA